jgi:hypothetical protein
MRYSKVLLAVAVIAGLAGCSAPASVPPPTSGAVSGAGPASSPGSVSSSGPASTSGPVSAAVPSSASGAPPAGRTSTAEPAAAPAGPAEAKTRAAVRAAAASFYRLYSSSQFGASWDLLAVTAKKQVPQSVWVGVHEACPSVGAGMPRAIKSVVVFGDAAIVTETITGTLSRLGPAEDVFNYANGHWGFSPGEPGIYHRGSVAADIAAAKAAGFCANHRSSPM